MTPQLPQRAGVGLKAMHYNQILDELPDLGWFEIHPENYMGDGGLPHYFLEKIRQHYPLSFHGVGMSLGSVDGVSKEYINSLKLLIDRYQPTQVSEHLSWSHWNQNYFNDLLPLAYNEQSLALIANNINYVQSALQRQILVENPSTYLSLETSTMEEAVFLNQLVEKTGCGLLLDINNVYVSAHNNGWSSAAYLEKIDLNAVGEIHLAGHTIQRSGPCTLLIDDHGSKVSADVCQLFADTLDNSPGTPPVLIEWDTHPPEWLILFEEAMMADRLIQESNTHCIHVSALNQTTMG